MTTCSGSASRVGFWTVQNYFKADNGLLWSLMDFNGINPSKIAQKGLFLKYINDAHPKHGENTSVTFPICCSTGYIHVHQKKKNILTMNSLYSSNIIFPN